MRIRIAIGAVLAGLGSTVTQGALAQEDPATVGPYSVGFQEYGSFDQPDFEQFGSSENETRAEVYYPDPASGGPFPIVFFVHGRHFVCWNVDGETMPTQWPCASDKQPYFNYKGYRFVAERLASQGIIAVSISANGLASHNVLDDGYQRLIEYHIDNWRARNTAAPPSTWRDKVDFSRVGLVGHSRGGEGVMDYARDNPNDVAAVLAIAPTGGSTTTPLSTPALAVLLGYCDGDTEDLRGVGYVDQARYGSAPLYTVLALGANHNYFNRYWTPASEGGPTLTGGVDPPNEDDWDQNYGTDSHCTSQSRLSGEEQRGVGLAYMTAFFRTHLLRQSQFGAYLQGDALPPPSALTDEIHTGYLPRAHDLREINRFSAQNQTTWTSGVTGSICNSSGSTPNACQPGISDMQTHFFGSLTLNALKVSWNTTGQSVTNPVAVVDRNVTGFGAIQFRVAVNHSAAASLNPVGSSRDFSVQLTDGVTSQSVAVSDYADVLYYPPGDAAHRKNIMNTVRIPLDAFGNLDRNNITSVNFVFNRSSTGSLLISDLAFSDKSAVAAVITWQAASASFLFQ
jgi:pimeloyl-ACP methyl ester carboxylesterase